MRTEALPGTGGGLCAPSGLRRARTVASTAVARLAGEEQIRPFRLKGNDAMAVSLGSGNSLMRLIAGVVETALIDSVSEEESVRSHRAVVDAIEAGDRPPRPPPCWRLSRPERRGARRGRSFEEGDR